MELGFNTTLVTVLSKNLKKYGKKNCVSIQLLLLFYFRCLHLSNQLCTFQYNSCYCSIYRRLIMLLPDGSFNTTLVTVLLPHIAVYLWCVAVSIQLLLLFYLMLENGKNYDIMFQYNSCYCSMEYYITKIYIDCEFQYNSCYCSIIGKAQNWAYSVVFQYNSCYCSIVMVDDVA